jgi:TolB protein
MRHLALIALSLLAAPGCALFTPPADRQSAALTVAAPEQPIAPAYEPFDPLSPLDEMIRPSGTWASITAAGLQRHTHTEVGADFDPCLSPDRSWLVFASTRHSASPALYRQRVDGIAVTQLTDDGAAVQPCISPDGAQIAFASNRAGTWDIWVIGLDGSAPVQITDGRGDELHPSYSPDGSQIAYCERDRHGQWSICLTDARAGGVKGRLCEGLFPSWSPDGERLVFQRPRARGPRGFGIWTIELVDGEPRLPTEIAADGTASFIAPCWSPDGTAASFVALTPPSPDASSETGNFASREPTAELWTVDLTGRHRSRLPIGQSGFGPTWSSDGRIYFSANLDGAETIWSIQAGLGASAEAQAASPAATPDGSGEEDPARTTLLPG